MWYPIHAINLNILQVKGRSDLFLRLEIIKKIVGVCIMCITIPLGITAMCIGMVVSSFISLFINTHYTGKLIYVGYIKQMRDLLPIFINSLIMGGIVYLCIQISDNDIVQLSLGIVVGLISYIGGASMITRSELKEYRNLLKR